MGSKKETQGATSKQERGELSIFVEPIHKVNLTKAHHGIASNDVGDFLVDDVEYAGRFSLSCLCRFCHFIFSESVLDA